MANQVFPINDTVNVASPYYMFKYSIRSEITRKYYERRLRTFFDFNGFLVGVGIEVRCNLFAERGKKDNDWTTVLIIKFLQYSLHCFEDFNPRLWTNFLATANGRYSN